MNTGDREKFPVTTTGPVVVWVPAMNIGDREKFYVTRCKADGNLDQDVYTRYTEDGEKLPVTRSKAAEGVGHVTVL